MNVHAIVRLLPMLLGLAACFDNGKSGDDDDDDGGDAGDDTGVETDGGTGDGGTGDGGAGDGGTPDGGTSDGGGGDGGGGDGGGGDGGGGDGGSGDGGGGDGGGGDGGGGDGGGGDGGAAFEPTVLLVDVSTGYRDKALAEVTYEGDPVGSWFVFMLVDDDWSGPDDSEHFCAVYFDVADATPSEDCADCWGDAAWTFDGASALAGTEGECGGLDPDVWGEDVGEFFADFAHGFGFGPSTDEFSETLEDAAGDEWDTYADAMVSNWIMTELTGSTEWYELNYLLVYEVDASTGELVLGDDGYLSMLEVAASEVAVDGYYNSGYFYGFTL